jgi:hydroxyacylglutathione hydrolase
MIFTQHYLDCLSQGSYLIGDETTGRAVVVDPRRDIDDYLSEAAEHGLRIERVIETHIHAYFLSGHLELAAATGALISYGEDAEDEFPIEPLRDGQRISLGQVALEILATPGHTPESICIVVYENADDEVPYGMLTATPCSSATWGVRICWRTTACRRRRWPGRCTGRCTTNF